MKHANVTYLWFPELTIPKFCSGDWTADDQYFCFDHVQLEVVPSAPLCEVRNGVLIGYNIENSKSSSVIREFEIQYVVMGERQRV